MASRAGKNSSNKYYPYEYIDNNGTARSMVVTAKVETVVHEWHVFGREICGNGQRREMPIKDKWSDAWTAEKKEKERMRIEVGTYTAFEFWLRLAAGEVESIRYVCDGIQPVVVPIQMCFAVKELACGDPVEQRLIVDLGLQYLLLSRDLAREMITKRLTDRLALSNEKVKRYFEFDGATVVYSLEAEEKQVTHIDHLHGFRSYQYFLALTCTRDNVGTGFLPSKVSDAEAMFKLKSI